MLKIRSDYTLRNILDTHVVIGIGKAAYSPHQIMSLNQTGAFLWNLLIGGAEKKDLVESLCDEYDVTSETAFRDVEHFLAQLQAKALIEEV